MKLSDLKKEVGKTYKLSDMKNEIKREEFVLNAYKARDEQKRNELNKEPTVKKQSLPMKAIEYVNNLGYKAGKTLMQLGDVAAYNVMQNDVDNAKRVKDTNALINKKLGTNIQTPKSQENIINKYKNIKPISNLTQAIQKQEDASTTRLKAGNSNVENVITDIALAGGDMGIKAIPTLVAGAPLPLTIGLTTYADTFQNDMLKGIDKNKAGLHALGSGLISGGIESIAGIGASGASKALASTAGKKLLSIVPKNVASYISKASNSVLGKILKNAAGEALEEGLEYDVQRIYQNLVLDENTPRDVKEQVYSMMIGGGVGGLFGGGKALFNKKPSLPEYKPTENKTPSSPNMNKPISLSEIEQSFEPKTSLNNVEIDNGNILNQTETKEPLKSNLEPRNDNTVQETKTTPKTTNNTIEVFRIARQYENMVGENPTINELVNEISSVTNINRSEVLKEVTNLVNYGYFNLNRKNRVYETQKGFDVQGAGDINFENLTDYIEKIRFKTTEPTQLNTRPISNMATTIEQEQMPNTQNNTVEQTEDMQSKPIDQLYKQKKLLKQTYDNAVAKGSLTDTEKHFLDGLVKGAITFDDLPNTVRKANIQAMYDVKRPLNDIDRTINNTKKEIKSNYRQLANDLIQNSDTWKDKKTGLQYQRETMERNFRDIIPDSTEAEKINDTYFTKIHDNEALSTKTKNEYRGKIKALNLSDKAKYKVTFRQTEQGLPIFENVSERALVQLLGEGKINEDTVKSSGADLNKINNAVQTFRGIYDGLISQANDSLIRNGYAPVDYRQDYFPHFTEDTVDNLLGKVAKTLGFNVNTQELPTDIAGLTHTFKPGKKWVGNFLRRTSNATDFDAVKGFDRYIEGVSDVIHHTDDIQRLRALENELRYKYSSDGIKAEIDTLLANEDISVEDRQARINELFERDKTKLPHLVTELRNYTDTLAGKKNINDRNMEHRLGRGMYEVAKAMENRVASNMVALNPGSWLTNFIPLTQALGGVKTTNLLNGMKDTVSSAFQGDGMVDKSTFLTNRRGSEPLVKTTTQKVSGALVTPMQWIDDFTSESLVRARYYENMRNGMSEAEAMQDADKWTAGLMADRSKGALPTIFNEKNPVMKLFTMFQVEVNNQLGYFLKDVPREYKNKAIAELAGAYLKMFIGAWLYNELYEKITGRRAALDPIDIFTTAYDDFTDEDKKKGQAVIDTGKNILQELPFAGSLIDGGRIPISSALPSLPNLINAGVGLATGEMNEKKALSVLGKELSKPAYYIFPPTAGGQTKKIVETVDVIYKGGSYGVDKDGKDTLQFTAEPTLPNMLKSATFGKYSLPDAKRYVDSGFKSLGGKVTEQYKKAKENGITHEEFLAAYKALNNAESDKDKDGKTIYLSKSKNQINAIKWALPKADNKKLNYLYELFEISENVWKEPSLPNIDTNKIINKKKKGDIDINKIIGNKR